MRWSSVVVLSVGLACGSGNGGGVDTDGGTATDGGTDTSASGSSAATDSDGCLIGTLDCPCSHGGSCITGLMCEDDVCVPDPDATAGGSSTTGVTTDPSGSTGATSSGTTTGATTGTGGSSGGSGSTSSTGGGVSMTFDAVQDTFVQGSAPDFNTGQNTTLSVHWTPHKALVMFDAAAVSTFIAGQTIAEARLELEISGVGAGWGAGNPIAAHRMTQTWTEDGATFNCAIDTTPGNNAPNCMAPNDWDMDGPNFPYVGTASDSVVITEASTGTVVFDVTADVQAFADGAAQNHGFAVIKSDEQELGGLSFHSREGTVAPRLYIELP